MYATPQHLRDRYPEMDLVQLTDPEAVEVNVDKLTDALRDAAGEINTYLQGRYPLPLQDVPEHLVTVACDIAMYRLQVLRPQVSVEDARARFKDALRWLEGVATGKLQLGLGSVGQKATAPGAAPEVIEQGRRFTRASMHGF